MRKKRKPNLPAAAAGRFISKLVVYDKLGRVLTLYNLVGGEFALTPAAESETPGASRIFVLVGILNEIAEHRQPEFSGLFQFR